MISKGSFLPVASVIPLHDQSIHVLEAQAVFREFYSLWAMLSLSQRQELLKTKGGS